MTREVHDIRHLRLAIEEQKAYARSLAEQLDGLEPKPRTPLRSWIRGQLARIRRFLPLPLFPCLFFA